MSDETNKVEPVEGEYAGTPLDAGGRTFIRSKVFMVAVIVVAVVFAVFLTFMVLWEDTPETPAVQPKPSGELERPVETPQHRPSADLEVEPTTAEVYTEPEQAQIDLSLPEPEVDQGEVEVNETEPFIPEFHRDPSIVELPSPDRTPLERVVNPNQTAGTTDPNPAIQELIAAIRAPTAVRASIPIPPPPSELEPAGFREIHPLGLGRGSVIPCNIMHNLTYNHGTTTQTPVVIRCKVNSPVRSGNTIKIPADSLILGEVSGLVGDTVEVVAEELIIGNRIHNIRGTFASVGGAIGVEGRVRRHIPQQALLGITAGLLNVGDAIAQTGASRVPYQIPLSAPQGRTYTTQDGDGNETQHTEPPSQAELNAYQDALRLQHEASLPSRGALLRAGAAGSLNEIAGSVLLSEMVRLSSPTIELEVGARLVVVLLEDWSPEG